MFRKCARNWEIMHKYSKLCEIVQNCGKVWKICKLVWKNANVQETTLKTQNHIEVWESTQSSNFDYE